MHALSEIPVSMRCYVDDRLLYGASVDDLQTAITCTEQWDTDRGFRTRQKTVACSTQGMVDLAWTDGTKIPQVDHHDYIGMPLLMSRVPAQRWFEPKMQRIEATIVRL